MAVFAQMASIAPKTSSGAEPALPYGKQFTPTQTPLSRLVPLLGQHAPDRARLEAAVAARMFRGKRQVTTLAMNCFLSIRSYGLVEDHNTGYRLTDLGNRLVAAAVHPERQHAILARHILTNLNGLSVIQVVRGRFARGEDVKRQHIADDLRVLGIDPGGVRGEHISSLHMWLAEAGVVDQGWRVSRRRLREVLGITQADLDALADYSTELKAFLRALTSMSSRPPFNSQTVAGLADQQSETRLKARRNLPMAVLEPLRRDGWLTYRKATAGRGAKPTLVTPSRRLRRLKADLVDAVATQASLPDPAVLRRPLRDLLQRARRARTSHTRGQALEGVAIQVVRMMGARFVAWRLRPEDTGGYELDVVAEKTNGRYERILVQSKVTAIASRSVIDREVAIGHLLEHADTLVFVCARDIGTSPRAAANQYMRMAPLAILFLEGDDLDLVARTGDLASLIRREYDNVEDARASADGIAS